MPVLRTTNVRHALGAARWIGLVLLMALVPDAAMAQAPIPRRPERITLIRQVPEERGHGRIGIRPDALEWHRMFRAGSARVIDFPLPGGARVELELASIDVLRPDTRFFVGGPDGLTETSAPAMRFFRGQVAGDRDSLVSLNLFDGRIAGFVRTGGKEYTLGPRAFARDRAGADDIQVVEDAVVAGPGFRCDGDDSGAGGAARVHDAVLATDGAPRWETLAGRPSPATIDSSTLLMARIAIEGTVEWVNKLGGVTAAEIYTLNLMSQVSAVYESEVRVQIQVPFVLMNSAEQDGYSGGSNSTSTELNEMRTRWNGTPALQQVFRSAAHLFSTYPSGGAGRAYVNVLCSDVPANSGAADFGVSLLEGNGASFERLLVAHEIGHNFSSPHSHCYVPELDQCNNTEAGCYSGPVVQTTGTIMSYCNSRITSFHQRERDEKIRPGAEAAFPACVEVAGKPGEVLDVAVNEANLCGAADLQSDDGTYNGSYSYSGTIRAAWVKRVTPSCYPFKLTGLDVQISNPSVAAGRAVRLLVYADPTGSGSPRTATLVDSEDTAVQVVSGSLWNHYTLAAPVVINSGDYYVGLFDLVADTAATYIMNYDSSRGGDSWWQPDSTDPTAYVAFPPATGTWMIRVHGSGVTQGSLLLTWDPPCNDATVPNQDFAVYQGVIGQWATFASLTCTTAHQRSWLIENPPAGLYWLVVPQNSANEGSYGQATSGDRSPAASPCKPQAVDPCQ
jgi:Metallo-peptidase family M12